MCGPACDGSTGWRARVTARLGPDPSPTALVRVMGNADQLVRATGELITDRRGTSFTVQEVAKRSRVSLTTLYSYFDGKDGLLLAVLEDSVEAGARILRERIGAERDPLARVRASVVETLRLGLDREGAVFSLLFAKERHRLEETYAEEVWGAVEPMARVLQEGLEDAARHGIVDSADPARDAVTIMRLVGSFLYGPKVLDGGAPEDVAEYLWQFCAHGLGVAGADTR